MEDKLADDSLIPFPGVTLPPQAPAVRLVLDREARKQKLKRLKIGVALAGLAGTGLFCGLATANSHSAASHAITPDQQVSDLENHGGGFFSGGGIAPPSASSGAPQTYSGGS